MHLLKKSTQNSKIDIKEWKGRQTDDHNFTNPLIDTSWIYRSIYIFLHQTVGNLQTLLSLYHSFSFSFNALIFVFIYKLQSSSLFVVEVSLDDDPSCVTSETVVCRYPVRSEFTDSCSVLSLSLTVVSLSTAPSDVVFLSFTVVSRTSFWNSELLAARVLLVSISVEEDISAVGHVASVLGSALDCAIVSSVVLSSDLCGWVEAAVVDWTAVVVHGSPAGRGELLLST